MPLKRQHGATGPVYDHTFPDTVLNFVLTPSLSFSQSSLADWIFQQTIKEENGEMRRKLLKRNM